MGKSTWPLESDMPRFKSWLLFLGDLGTEMNDLPSLSLGSSICVL